MLLSCDGHVCPQGTPITLRRKTVCASKKVLEVATPPSLLMWSLDKQGRGWQTLRWAYPKPGEWNLEVQIDCRTSQDRCNLMTALIVG